MYRRFPEDCDRLWFLAFAWARVAAMAARAAHDPEHAMRAEFTRRGCMELARARSRDSTHFLNLAFDNLASEQVRLFGGTSRWSW